MSQIPTPGWALNLEHDELSDGRIQVSFVVEEEYPSSRVRDFYAEWASRNGWEKVPNEVDSWSNDEWISFLDEDGVDTDSYFVHWRSPDNKESLYLALIYKGQREKQEAYVILSPFHLVAPAADEPKTLGDYIDDWERSEAPPG
jgi:hypothetical protein